MCKHSRMALVITALAFSACQKSIMDVPSAPISTHTTASIGTIPIGALTLWLNAGNLPFSDGEPGDIPSADTYPLGFAINGKGYVCGSILYDSHGSPQTIHNMWEYDLGTGTWTEKAPIPGYPPVEGACFVIGDNAYVICPTSQATYRYNQPTNTWSIAATLPANPERFSSTAFAVNGKGYAGLGDGETVNGNFVRFNDWWEYDPVTNTWTKKHNFPGGQRIYAAGFAVDGKGYICSGEKLSGSVNSWPNDLWQFDPATDTWVQKANMPGPGLSAVGLNGIVNSGGHYGFVVTGGPGGCLEYNPATDKWGKLPDMPGGSRQQFAAFMINRSLFIGGGFGGGFNGRMDAHVLVWSK